MTFPIDIDSILQDSKESRITQELIKIAVSLANGAYQDGHEGKPFIFQDEPAEVKVWEKANGRPITPPGRKFLHNLIELCRKAYDQGKGA